MNNELQIRIESYVKQISKYERDISVIRKKIGKYVDKIFTESFGVKFEEEFENNGSVVKLQQMDESLAFLSSRMLITKNKNGTWRKRGQLIRLDDVLDASNWRIESR